MDHIIKIMVNDNELDIIFNKNNNIMLKNKKNIKRKYNDKILIKICNKKITKSWISSPIFPYLNKKNKHIYRINEIEKWPSKTYIKCWNCTLNIDTIPIGIPYKINNDMYYKKKYVIFYVNGCFCSFPCAYRYDYIINNNQHENYLYILYEYFGYDGTINMAPDKNVMVDYGGYISEEIYKQKVMENKKIICTRKLPPIISITPSTSFEIFKKNKYIKYNI